MNDFQTFWYVLATGLEKLSDNVSELKATAAVHAQKLKEHDDKIDTLSDDVANQIIAKLRMITPRK